MKNKIILGDCLEKLKGLDDNSIDSIVTDPPYELGFMGKKWDNSGIAYNVEMWKECLRVLKPGGHLLSFGGTRTYHRMAVAIEDVGFEVRDMIEWVYGSGFPKSLNIGKAVDKLQGNEREDLGEYEPFGREGRKTNGKAKFDAIGWDTKTKMRLTKGNSPYEGWGTALKPAHEPICMARKPLAEKTVAENCLKYGTGGINIDGCRVGTNPGYKYRADANGTTFHGQQGERIKQTAEKKGSEFIESTLGRFPANLIHDNSEEVRECFPESNNSGKKLGIRSANSSDFFFKGGNNEGIREFGDSGNASRFFKSIEKPSYIGKVYGETDGRSYLQTKAHGINYKNTGNPADYFKSIIYTAKASKSERNKGCEDMEAKYNDDTRIDKDAIGCNNPNNRSGTPSKNFHPTVKPIALMEYLIKMVTPKGGVVLDPFAGSGSTLVAAKQNGFDYIGIELTEEYIPIIEARLSDVKNVQEELFNNQFTNLKEK